MRSSFIRKPTKGHGLYLVAYAVLAAASLYSGSSISQPAESAAVTTESKFQHLYPGVWTDREATALAKYFADNRALKERGPIDVQRLIRGELPKDTPGLGPVIDVTEGWVRYNNAKVDPENPLRNDRAYARAAGYADILAFPTFGAHDDTFMVPFPPAVRDRLLVSDLNHSVTTYRPIYPGDKLFLVANERDVIELTPTAGSEYRSVAINTRGSVYNQRGEKVNDVVFRVTESVKEFKNSADIPKNPGFFDIWVAPNWLARPAHFYTDNDWKKITDIWKQEKRRGSEPLYWEDVEVGSRPALTLDGPVLASVAPVAPWGMGSGGSRTTKREILDPKTFATMVRGEKDGIWRLRERESYVPSTPVQPGSDGKKVEAGAITTTDIHKDGEQRSPLVNYMGRDFAIRHLDNWMGDKGWLQNIRWSIMEPAAMAANGMTVPVNPDAVRYLAQLPSMKGRHLTAHGLTQDVAIVKSEVLSKEVRNGAYLVDLIWWIENLDGDIWLEGGATIKLPSKRAR